MQTQRKAFYTVLTAVLASATQLSPASAGTLTDNKTVRTSADNVIRSEAFGTCVRTKWEKGENVCAPEPAKKPEPKTMTKTVIGEVQRKVYFDFNKATLTPESQKKLDHLAQKLRGADDIKGAQIVGFADRIGNSDYNIQLSKARAEAVQNYLTSRNYLNAQVAEVRGLGESQSITDCSTQLDRQSAIECLSADRRVEVEVEYTDTKQLTRSQ